MIFLITKYSLLKPISVRSFNWKMIVSLIIKWDRKKSRVTYTSGFMIDDCILIMELFSRRSWWLYQPKRKAVVFVTSTKKFCYACMETFHKCLTVGPIWLLITFELKSSMIWWIKRVRQNAFDKTLAWINLWGRGQPNGPEIANRNRSQMKITSDDLTNFLSYF